LEVLSEANIKKTNGRKDLGVFWRSFEALQVHFNCVLVILLSSVYFPKFNVSCILFLNAVCLFEVVNRVFIHPQIFIRKALVKIDFPVFLVEVEAFVIHINCCFVSA
jgi:hypothetical protein